MPVISSIFLVIALVMAVAVGPQTRSWTWGPAMLALGISTLAALPIFWKRDKPTSDFGLIAFGTLVAGWFAWRTFISPVAELGQTDLLLLCGVVGSFLSIRAIAGNMRAEQILIWGIALLLFANLVVVGRQIADPTFTPIFRERSAATMISGFFAHYNEAANYLIASALLVGAAGLFGRHSVATRLFWILLSIGGLAAVWFTRSRGGILGAAIGLSVFAMIAMLIGKRRGTKWFGPALTAIPLIGMAIGGFLLMGWQSAQEARVPGAGISGLFDNNSRLYFLGIALSCINLHPLLGGGSRSFSWECFRFVDAKAQGDIITHNPELVHNELVQAATDFGLIGAVLLIGLLGALAVAVILRVILEEASPESVGSRDAWRLGALTALVGMLVQSCFSFVFHLMPGALLLGICLGQMSRPSSFPGKAAQRLGSGILLSTAAVACSLILLNFGWQGTQVTRILWATYFSKKPLTATDSKIDALSEAIRLWPLSSFYQDRALNYQTLSTLAEAAKEQQEADEAAVKDYLEAAKIHPYEPSLVINRANLLSKMQKDTEAEEAFALGLRLQGGMEPGFRGHLSLANHFMRKGLRLFNPDTPIPALNSLEQAAAEVETAVAQMHWKIEDMLDSRLSIHESLGTAREANDDRVGAMESYRFAMALQDGNRSHYRAGILTGKMAAEAWSSRRPSEALAYFIKARGYIAATRELPPGVTSTNRAEYLAYLDQTIAFLKGANIQPAAETQ